MGDMMDGYTGILSGLATRFLVSIICQVCTRQRTIFFTQSKHMQKRYVVVENWKFPAELISLGQIRIIIFYHPLPLFATIFDCFLIPCASFYFCARTTDTSNSDQISRAKNSSPRKIHETVVIWMFSLHARNYTIFFERTQEYLWEFCS